MLFLNNALNHGMLTPLGIQQAPDTGKSILFLLESNPAPAWASARLHVLRPRPGPASAPGALIIHFFGGIHEIYFPYVLMKPVLILAAIGGGAAVC